MRPHRSGIGMTISRSNLPGRRRAGSRALGMLVAAMTMTFCLLFRPSMRRGAGRRPAFHVSDNVFPAGGDGVDLIDEQDAGSLFGCLFKDFPEVGLAFAVKLVDDLRAADGKELASVSCAMARAMRVFPQPVGRKGAHLWARRSPNAQRPRDNAAAARSSP